MGMDVVEGGGDIIVGPAEDVVEAGRGVEPVVARGVELVTWWLPATTPDWPDTWLASLALPTHPSFATSRQTPSDTVKANLLWQERRWLSGLEGKDDVVEIIDLGFPLSHRLRLLVLPPTGAANQLRPGHFHLRSVGTRGSTWQNSPCPRVRAGH